METEHHAGICQSFWILVTTPAHSLLSSPRHTAPLKNLSLPHILFSRPLSYHPGGASQTEGWIWDRRLSGLWGTRENRLSCAVQLQLCFTASHDLQQSQRRPKHWSLHQDPATQTFKAIKHSFRVRGDSPAVWSWSFDSALWFSSSPVWFKFKLLSGTICLFILAHPVDNVHLHIFSFSIHVEIKFSDKTHPAYFQSQAVNISFWEIKTGFFFTIYQKS